MKILVVTQYFWPEEFRINDICKEFIKEGHEVDVLTGIPNYPKGEFYEGYSNSKIKKENYDGINIFRVPIIPRSKGLILNYSSFMIAGAWKALFLKKNYDRIFVFQLSPITIAIPGIIVSKMKKIHSTIYIQDIWPESLYSIKNIKNERFKKVANNACMKIYKSFDKVLITSKRFEKILVEKGIERSKIHYLPQWAEEIYTMETMIEKEKEFYITFAGNIGKAQSVETIIKAMEHIEKDIKLKLIGDGSEFENIKKLIKKMKLENRIEILGRRPVQEMPNYFAQSEVLVVTLQNEFAFNSTLPAKVQSYMASGKPIVAAINGEGRRVIEESKCGLVGTAEDYIELSENISKLYKISREKRNEMGRNGIKFLKENFNKEKLFNEIKGIMQLK